ncbi:hypothetical protein AAVH_25478 [Aphelenchoides avenae]|nr:hypothetical protein AAVH_25478 [Aphelenchus avenae]
MTKFWRGVIVLNHLRPPYGDAFVSGLLSSSPQAQILNVPHTYGALRSLQCDGDTDAYVVNLFGKNGAIEPRICARGLSLPSGDAWGIASPELQIAGCPRRAASGSLQVPVLCITTAITYMYKGLVSTDITFEWLSRCLISLLEEQYFQERMHMAGGLLLSQAERFITTRCELHQYMNKRAVLSFLSHPARDPRWSGLFDLRQELAGVGEDEMVLPGDVKVASCIRRHINIDLTHVHEGRLVGFLLEYGTVRLGGVFITFNERRRTLSLGYAFARPDLLSSCFMTRFLAAVIKYQGYARWFDVMERRFRPTSTAFSSQL